MTKFTKGECGICANCVPQIDGGSGFKNCQEAHAAQLAEDATMQFTKEQLIGQAEANIMMMKVSLTHITDRYEREDIGIDLRLAEIALAVLTSEPIGWMDELTDNPSVIVAIPQRLMSEGK